MSMSLMFWRPVKDINTNDMVLLHKRGIMFVGTYAYAQNGRYFFRPTISPQLRQATEFCILDPHILSLEMAPTNEKAKDMTVSGSFFEDDDDD